MKSDDSFIFGEAFFGRGFRLAVNITRLLLLLLMMMMMATIRCTALFSRVLYKHCFLRRPTSMVGVSACLNICHAL